MTTEQKYFTEEEMKERIMEVLRWQDSDSPIDESEIHHQAFNSNYYIVGVYKAREALLEFDVFEAIEIVQEWEMSTFGEKHEDVSNPERLANILWYVLGDKYLRELEPYQYETCGEMLEALEA